MTCIVVVSFIAVVRCLVVARLCSALCVRAHDMHCRGGIIHCCGEMLSRCTSVCAVRFVCARMACVAVAA